MATPIVDAAVPRLVPQLTPANRPYWTGGAEGRLLIPRCAACDRLVDPFVDACPSCGGELVPEPVSGRGSVFSFTVNAQAWNPEVPTPYVVALVALDEQPDVVVPTNVVNCEPGAVEIGMAVQVLFERQADGEVFVPLFEPAT